VGRRALGAFVFWFFCFGSWLYSLFIIAETEKRNCIFFKREKELKRKKISKTRVKGEKYI
jgi:hypothetical protein